MVTKLPAICDAKIDAKKAQLKEIEAEKLAAEKELASLEQWKQMLEECKSKLEAQSADYHWGDYYSGEEA
jgi:ribosome assembly protein YihI (activator of Der GTPase)